MSEWVNDIHQGDAFDVLADLPDESIHAVVCDPPYGLAFMGRSWDDFEPREYQEWCEKWARECLRVLKPGGHLLAFSGNRTHHRLFSGVEDAGFEIRDTLTWHYGSGFPKALDVSKAIDDKVGEEGDYGAPKSERAAKEIEYASSDKGSTWHEGFERPWMDDEDAIERNAREYVPGSDGARKWNGWKTHLKPATEFVVCARKPLPGTVAECVLEHGTGAMNIDGCRVDAEERTKYEKETAGTPGNSLEGSKDGSLNGNTGIGTTDLGRYPSNLILDETAAAELDREVGTLTSGSRESGIYDGAGDTAYGEFDETNLPSLEASEGGPSRYFYTSKATKAERTLDGRIDNTHPTVKPQDLMEWLVRLVAAEGQIVLDPFAGSGTTCKAAKVFGRRFVGIEKQAKWADVARVRCGLTPVDPSHVRPDDDQAGLEAFADGGSDD